MNATSVANIQDEFLDVMLADDDLLRAEFDAIIGATWPPSAQAPAPTPSRSAAPRPQHEGAALRYVRVDNIAASPPATAQARYRSPPQDH